MLNCKNDPPRAPDTPYPVQTATDPRNTYLNQIKAPSEAQIATTLIEVPTPAASAKATHTFNPSFFLRDLREAVEHAVSGYDSYLKSLKISDPAKMVINTSLGIGMTTAFFISPTITTGVSALAIWQIGISFQSNRHSRIASIVASSLFSVYMAALGLYEFTLCASAGIARSSVQTMIADDRPATRAAVAIVGFFATALVYTSTTALNSLATLEHAPLITLGLGALGGAFCERLSWATRLTQLSGALLSLAYHSLVSGSALGLVGTILFLPGVLRSIYIYDLNKLWKQKKPSQPLASK